LKKLLHFLAVGTLLITSALSFSFAAYAADNPQDSPEEHTLTIEYQNEDGSQAFPAYTSRMAEGEEYSVTSPKSEEAVPTPSEVSGVMGNEDVSEIVTYASYRVYVTINYVFEDGSQAAPPYTNSFTVSSSNQTVMILADSPSVPGYLPSQSRIYFGYSIFSYGNPYTTTVTYYPAYTLKIKYLFPDGSEAAPPVNKTLAKGNSFSITSPSIDGYSPDHAVISGTMDSELKSYTVTYIPVQYTLTIDYLYEDGTQAHSPYSKTMNKDSPYNVASASIKGFTPDIPSVAGNLTEDTHITVTYKRTSWPLTIRWLKPDGTNMFRGDSVYYIEPGRSYSYTSSAVKGYTPDIPVVSGTMPNEALTVTVTYSLKVSNLVIDYLYPDGSEASPSVSLPYEYNQQYDVPSPEIQGCTPDTPSVSGVMGEEDIHVTVTYTRDNVLLTIKYQYEGGGTASPSYSESLKPGDSYNIKSPSIKGHTADKSAVSGIMPSDNLTVTVTYSPVLYTLTIRYQFEDGSEAAPPYSVALGYNKTFSVPSPAVSGFAPDRSVVSGRMSESDATFTITYKKPKYLLTIRYSHQNGSRIAADYTGRYEEGEKYEVRSPSVMGYTTSNEIVSGVMPAHNVVRTASYFLEGSANLGDTSKLLNVISSSGEYIQVYISKTLVTLVTVGLIIFAAIVSVRWVLRLINYFTRS